MNIKKNISIFAVFLIIVSFTVGPVAIVKVQAASSLNKAEIYLKISTSSSNSRNESTKGENGPGSTCSTISTDEVSFIVEGTTGLKSDIFDTTEGFKVLLPVERDIKASCSGGGSENISATSLETNTKSMSFVEQKKLFPFSSQKHWSYSMDGKELLDEYGEIIELVNSLNIYPSEKKGETPTYEININTDALAAINYYHVIARGNYSSKSQDFEGTYTDSGVIKEDGTYCLSLMCATGYTEAIESDEAQKDFVKGKFKLENDKFVSSGSLSYTYKTDGYEDCTIHIEYTINRDPQIKNIQVNQVLGRYEYIDDENYEPATDFVAGKQTAIQVFFFNETPVDKIEDAKLEVYRNGAKIAILKDFEKDKNNNALNFIPNNSAQCENWKAGNYRFKALYKDTEFVLDNVEVSKMPKLRILAVPLKLAYDGIVNLPGNEWMYGHSFLKKVFPIAEEDIEWIIRPDPLDLSSDVYDLLTEKGRWNISEKLKKLQASNSSAQYDIIAGFMASSADGYLGYTYRNLSIVVSNEDPDMPATVAHEIGHLYNLGEEYNGGAYNTTVNMPPYGFQGRDWYNKKTQRVARTKM